MLKPEQLVLPLSLISPVDLSRTLRELGDLNDALAQASARKPNSQLSLPRTSARLDEVAKTNNLNLLDNTARTDLATALEALKLKVPLIHISFAADPTVTFLQKITEWLRSEIHPQLLVTIGLQPSIAAGCVVRTASRYFDFSLRRHLLDQRQLLVDHLSQSPR